MKQVSAVLLAMMLAAATQGASAAGHQRRATFDVTFTVTAACVIDPQAGTALACTAGTPYRIIHDATSQPASVPVASITAQPATTSALRNGDTVYF
ncbi:hypothetical protein IP91_01757 [Pseudoduganella lurida]|uniref:Uncharacterized protein n=1 Tax=Pseudoduganella lurida TaxID=1036180 RepID=A0A562RGY9_9BURK|nr:hypothetical protein [Pseudoduganella lurida]TWI67640.1 hypothetical protein IP91_01757 [Pseudoduganella lurida]